MTATGSELLRALGASIGPARPERAGGAPGAGWNGGIETVPFADLLARARSGAVSSGLPVSIAPGAGIELTDDQLTRLSAAADRAEAAGATRALVLIDGMTLRLDVGVRSITGVADIGASGVLTGIDAVLRAPPSGAAGAAALVPPGAGRGGGAAQNASLLRTLAATPDRPAR